MDINQKNDSIKANEMNLNNLNKSIMTKENEIKHLEYSIDRARLDSSNYEKSFSNE